MKIILLFLVSGVIFVGCADDEKPSLQPKPQSIPDQLVFAPSPKRSQLTPTEKEELKLAIGERPALVVPEAELIFSSDRFRSSEFQDKEANLRKQSEVSYRLLKDIQTGCSSIKPTQNPVGNLVVNDNGPNYEKVKFGDDLVWKTAARLEGENCPIKLDSQIEAAATVYEVDNQKNSGTANGSLGHSGQAIVVSPKYERILRTRGLILSAKVNAVNIRQSADNKIHYKHTFRGTYLSMVQNIPIEGNAEMLVKTDKNGIKTNEFMLSIRVATKKVTVYGDYYSKDVNNVNVEKKHFLNGFSASQAEFDEVFGKHNPLVDAKQSAAKVLRN